MIRQVITNIIYAVFALVEIILGLRFILKLFGADAGNAFVAWLYETSGAILDPFRGIFPTQVFQSNFVLEFSTLFAIILYAIIALLLIWIINAITAPIEDAVEADTRTTTTTTRKR
jgi:uncharacterized protein YggT (Ycf19 family)